jgi:hypothetical protein
LTSVACLTSMPLDATYIRFHSWDFNVGDRHGAVCRGDRSGLIGRCRYVDIRTSRSRVSHLHRPSPDIHKAGF